MNVGASAIIKEARSWVDTDFLHQGRTRKNSFNSGGCDCLGLIMGIAKNLDLQTAYGQKMESLDCRNYPKLPDGTALRQTLENNLITISSPKPGSIGLFSFMGRKCPPFVRPKEAFL